MWSVDDHSDLQLQTDLPWGDAPGLPPARPLLRSEVSG
jgi:hypothetical protein